MLGALKKPALLVIDMQNDFVREGSPLEVPSSRATIPTIRELIEAFRRARYPVVYTRYVADEFYRSLSVRFAWMNLLQPPRNACVVGFERHYRDIDAIRPVVSVVDELLPQPGDAIIDKIYYSAFHQTDLQLRLGALEVDAVVVVGTITEMCGRGYGTACRPFRLSDCSGVGWRVIQRRSSSRDYASGFCSQLWLGDVRE